MSRRIPDDLMTQSEAARRVDVKRQSLNRAIQRGDVDTWDGIPGIRLVRLSRVVRWSEKFGKLPQPVAGSA